MPLKISRGRFYSDLKELQEQKSKEALELLGRKHKLGQLEKGRDPARMLQGRERSGAEGDFTDATDSSSFCSCSPSLAYEGKRLEKLEVDGGFSGAQSGSMDPKGKTDHWSVRWRWTRPHLECRRRVSAALKGREVSLSYVCPHVHRYSFQDYIWCVSMMVTVVNFGIKTVVKLAQSVCAGHATMQILVSRANSH